MYNFAPVKDYITTSLSKFRHLKTKENMVGEKNGQMEIVVRLVRYCMSFFILTKYEISDKVKQASSRDVLMYFLPFQLVN